MDGEQARRDHPARQQGGSGVARHDPQIAAKRAQVVAAARMPAPCPFGNGEQHDDKAKRGIEFLF